MKFDMNKPLPPHTKLDYYECLAKLVLESAFPNRYNNLQVIDKPDLQGNVGIEVTQADSAKDLEIESNMVKASYCENEEEKKRYMERMSQLGVPYTEPVQIWPGYIPSFDETRKATIRKVNRLKQGGYKYFPTYELFIITNMWFNEKVVNDATDFFFSQNGAEGYETVYVLSQGNFLHVFEIESKKHFMETVTQQFALAEKAREMVEEAEEMD